MKTQSTLILSLPRFEIPQKPNIVEILNYVILNNLVNIDYFGVKLNNDVDYVNEETILSYLLNDIMVNKIGEVIFDDKDIDVYIYFTP